MPKQEDPSQKIIVIKGAGRGKTHVANALALWYEKYHVPYKYLIAHEEGFEAKLKELDDFPGFIIIDTLIDNLPVAPWQIIDIAGGLGLCGDGYFKPV